MLPVLDKTNGPTIESYADAHKLIPDKNKKQQLKQQKLEIMKKLKTTTQMHEQMVENYEKLGK